MKEELTLEVSACEMEALLSCIREMEEAKARQQTIIREVIEKRGYPKETVLEIVDAVRRIVCFRTPNRNPGNPPGGAPPPP